MIKKFLQNIRLFSDGKTETTEFETGRLIERRSILWLPVLAAAALALPRDILAGRRVENSMTWEDFLKECLPKAAELHRDSSKEGQDAYLFWIASLAARLDPATLPKAKLGKFKDLDPPAEFGVGYRGVPFFVVEWKMSAGANFPPHNHPNASVCTVGIGGEARIRNFEVAGDAPEFSSDKTFNVRETHDGLIGAGRINALSAGRDNIHTFQVGKDGARGIDITTYHGENIGFSFLDIGGKPFDADKKLFEARWKKL